MESKIRSAKNIVAAWSCYSKYLVVDVRGREDGKERKSPSVFAC